MKLFSNIKGDILGGITTSVIALPLGIAFGIIAFAPLGSEYIAQGALAGLYGVIVAGILTSLLGGTPGQIAVPTAPMSVMVTSIIATLLKDKDIQALGQGTQLQVILVLVSMTILMAGILQLAMGAVGGGKLVKFIPYPVIGGFMNGIAIIIFLGQLRPFLGVPKETDLLALFSGAGIRYETVIVGAVTIVTMLIANRFIKDIPGSLVGLLCGVGTYFLIGKLFNPSLLVIDNNPLIIGRIPSEFPTPKQIGNFLALSADFPLRKLTSLIIPAATLSILASIDTLLTSVVTDMVTRQKHNSTKELLGQGLGNISSAIFGGLPVAGSTLATMVNINGGGKTPLSGVVNSVTVLLVVMLLSGVVQWIPMSVLAGILLITSVTMIEAESINLSLKKSALGNLVVIVAVTLITVLWDLIMAVLIGLAITTFMFIREQIGKSIVRRMYTGNLVHSKKVRSGEAMKILSGKGESIKVYELNGSLFFGTCDKLMSEIEQDLDSYCIVLDFKRVHTIDLTGAQLLKQVIENVQEKGNHFLASYLEMPGDEDKDRMVQLMQDAGVCRAIGDEFIFPDTDRALEWAEDALIDRERAAAQLEKERITIQSLDVFKGLTPEQLEVVRCHMHPLKAKKGDVIFEEGDPGDRIYFILSGGVSVLASITENGRARRLATFSEGVFFGDMAILEGRPRSASVHADSETELLYMTVDDFQDLVQNESLLASKMLMGMARELSYRLRMTTTEVRALEE